MDDFEFLDSIDPNTGLESESDFINSYDTQADRTRRITPNLGNLYLEPSKYDEGLGALPASEQLRYRARKQGIWDEIGNQGFKIIPAIALGILETAGYILDLENIGGITNMIDTDYNNWLSDATSKAKEKLDQAFPVYREDPNKTLDFTDSAFYVENIGGLVESIGEFGITGFGVGLGLGALSKGMKFGKGLTQLGTALSLTHAEGIGTGVDVYKEAKKDIIAKARDAKWAYKQLKPDESFNEFKTKLESGQYQEDILNLAKEKASDAANTTVRLNYANTLLNLSGVSAIAKAGTYGKKLASKAFKIKPNEGYKEYVTRLAQETGKNPLNLSKLGLESIQEAGEEFINVAAEQEGKRQIAEATGELSKRQQKQSFLERLGETFSSDEAILSMGLGALGGIGNTAFVETIGQKGVKEDRQNQLEYFINKANRYDAITKSIEAINNKEFEKAGVKPEEAEGVKAELINELLTTITAEQAQQVSIRGTKEGEEALYDSLLENPVTAEEPDIQEKVTKAKENLNKLVDLFDNTLFNEGYSKTQKELLSSSYIRKNRHELNRDSMSEIADKISIKLQDSSLTSEQKSYLQPIAELQAAEQALEIMEEQGIEDKVIKAELKKTIENNKSYRDELSKTSYNEIADKVVTEGLAFVKLKQKLAEINIRKEDKNIEQYKNSKDSEVKAFDKIRKAHEKVILEDTDDDKVVKERIKEANKIIEEESSNLKNESLIKQSNEFKNLHKALANKIDEENQKENKEKAETLNEELNKDDTDTETTTEEGISEEGFEGTDELPNFDEESSTTQQTQEETNISPSETTSTESDTNTQEKQKVDEKPLKDTKTEIAEEFTIPTKEQQAAKIAQELKSYDANADSQETEDLSALSSIVSSRKKQEVDTNKRTKATPEAELANLKQELNNNVKDLSGDELRSYLKRIQKKVAKLDLEEEKFKERKEKLNSQINKLFKSGEIYSNPIPLWSKATYLYAKLAKIYIEQGLNSLAKLLQNILKHLKKALATSNPDLTEDQINSLVKDNFMELANKIKESYIELTKKSEEEVNKEFNLEVIKNGEELVSKLEELVDGIGSLKDLKNSTATKVDEVIEELERATAEQLDLLGEEDSVVRTAIPYIAYKFDSKTGKYFGVRDKDGNFVKHRSVENFNHKLLNSNKILIGQRAYIEFNNHDGWWTTPAKKNDKIILRWKDGEPEAWIWVDKGQTPQQAARKPYPRLKNPDTGQYVKGRKMLNNGESLEYAVAPLTIRVKGSTLPLTMVATADDTSRKNLFKDLVNHDENGNPITDELTGQYSIKRKSVEYTIKDKKIGQINKRKKNRRLDYKTIDNWIEEHVKAGADRSTIKIGYLQDDAGNMKVYDQEGKSSLVRMTKEIRAKFDENKVPVKKGMTVITIPSIISKNGQDEFIFTSNRQLKNNTLSVDIAGESIDVTMGDLAIYMLSSVPPLNINTRMHRYHPDFNQETQTHKNNGTLTRDLLTSFNNAFESMVNEIKKFTNISSSYKGDTYNSLTEDNYTHTIVVTNANTDQKAMDNIMDTRGINRKKYLSRYIGFNVPVALPYTDEDGNTKTQGAFIMIKSNPFIRAIRPTEFKGQYTTKMTKLGRNEIMVPIVGGKRQAESLSQLELGDTKWFADWNFEDGEWVLRMHQKQVVLNDKGKKSFDILPDSEVVQKVDLPSAFADAIDNAYFKPNKDYLKEDGKKFNGITVDPIKKTKLPGTENLNYIDFISKFLSTPVDPELPFFNSTITLENKKNPEITFTNKVEEEPKQEIVEPNKQEFKEGEHAESADDLGLLRATEQKTVTETFKQEEIDWIKRNLKGVTVSVDRLNNLGNKLVHGYFNQAAKKISISPEAEEGTAYHEAFHAIIRLYNSKSQYNTLINEAKAKYKQPTQSDLEALKSTLKQNVSEETLINLYYEEKLAEQFREYMIKEITNKKQDKTLGTKILNFFKAVWNYLNKLIGRDMDIDTFFDYYATKPFPSNSIIRGNKNFIKNNLYHTTNSVNLFLRDKYVDSINYRLITKLKERYELNDDIHQLFDPTLKESEVNQIYNDIKNEIGNEYFLKKNEDNTISKLTKDEAEELIDFLYDKMKEVKPEMKRPSNLSEFIIEIRAEKNIPLKKLMVQALQFNKFRIPIVAQEAKDGLRKSEQIVASWNDESLKGREQKLGDEEFNIIEGTSEGLLTLAKRTLKDYKIGLTKKPYEGDEDKIYDRAFFEDDPKDKISPTLKAFLHTINKIDEEGNPVINSIGEYEFENYHELISSLYPALRGVIGYDNIRKVIKNLPQFNSVNKALEDLDKKISNNSTKEKDRKERLKANQIINSFVTTFTTQEIKMLLAKLVDSDEGGKFTIIDSNRSKLESIQLEKWYRDTPAYDLTLQDNDIESTGHRKMTKELKDKLSKIVALEYDPTNITNEDENWSDNGTYNLRQLFFDLGLFKEGDVANNRKLRINIINTVLGMSRDRAEKFMSGFAYIFNDMKLGKDVFKSQSNTLGQIASIAIVDELFSYTGVFTDHNGNQIYSINMPNQLSDYIARLKNGDKDLIDDLNSSPMNNPTKDGKHSSLLFRQLQDESNLTDFFYIDAFTLISNLGRRDNVDYSNMYKNDFTALNYNMYYNGDLNSDYFYLRIPPIPDTGNMGVFKLKRFKNEEDIFEEYYNLFVQDLAKIFNVKERQEQLDENDLIHNLEKVWDKKNNKWSTEKAKGLEFTNLKFLQKYLDTDQLYTALHKGEGGIDLEIAEIFDIKNIIKDLARWYLLGDVDALSSLRLIEESNTFLKPQFFKDINNPNFESQYKRKLDTAIKDIENQSDNTSIFAKQLDNEVQAFIAPVIRGQILHYNLYMPEILKLTSNNLSFYKNIEDWSKRYKESFTPGSKGNYNVKDKFRMAIVSEIYETNNEAQKPFYDLLDKLKENYTKKLIAMGETNVEATVNAFINKLKKAYLSENKTEIADAQGFVTIEKYRKTKDAIGEWTDLHEQAYQNILDGKPTAKDLKIVMQPLKTFTYTHQKITRIGKDGKEYVDVVPIQIKHSVVPLMKYFTEGNPNLEALRKRMEDKIDPIDMINFNSAIKVGNHKVGDIRKLNELETIEINQRDELIPQKIPVKDKKQTWGSQMRKLIFGNMLDSFTYDINGETKTGKELKEDYDKLVDRILAQSAEELERILPFKDFFSKIDEYNELINNNENDDVISDKRDEIIEVKRKFLSTLRRELNNSLEDRNLTKNYQEAITLIEDATRDVDFKVPLGFPLYANKFESILISIFKNKIGRQKVNGQSVVQVADLEGIYNGKVSESDSLGYELDENGNLIMDVKISHKMLRDKGIPEDITLEELREQGLDRMVGYRIPTQDKSSMVILRIKELIPKESGDIMVVPGKITTQTGSDFDIDKLFLMQYNYESYPSYKNRYKDGGNVFDYYLQNASIFENSIQDETAILEFLAEAEEKDLYEAEKGKFGVRFKGLGSLENKITKVLREYSKNTKAFDELTIRVKKVDYSNVALEDMSRAQIENYLVDMYTSILQSPYHMDEILNPLDSDILSNLRDDVRKKFNTNEELDFSDIETLDELSVRNTAGRALIGIYANHSVSHAMSQDIGLKLDEKIAIKYSYNENGKKQEIKLDDLSGIKDRKGNYISSSLSGLVNISVDNAKDPIAGELNINSYTANSIALLVRLGVDLKTAVSFYNTPIIRRYVEFLQTNKIPNSKVATSWIRFISQDRGISMDEAIKSFSYNFKNHTIRLDEKSINNFDSDEGFDLMMMKNFLSLHKIGSDLAKSNKALASDRTIDLSKVVELESWDENYSKFFRGELLMSATKEPTIAKAFRKHYVRNVLDVVRNFFVSSSGEFNKTRRIIEKYTGMEPTVRNINLINNDFILYLFSDPSINNPFKPDTIVARADDKGVWSRIQKYLDPKSKFDNEVEKEAVKILKNSNFISNLDARPLKDNPKYMQIMYRNILDRGTAQTNAIIDDFERLLKSDNDVVKFIAKDLVTYAFTLDGFNFNPTTFTTLIPLNYLIEQGYIRNYKTLASRYTKYSLDDPDGMGGGNPFHFLDQFIKNNPKTIPRLESKRDIEIKGSKALVGNESELFKKQGEDSWFLKAFTIRENNKDKLFLLTGEQDGKALYEYYEITDFFKRYKIDQPTLPSDNDFDLKNEESQQSKIPIVREYTPEKITSLKENEIFVFGSNPLGINGNPVKYPNMSASIATANNWVKQGEKMDNRLSDSGKAFGLTTVTAPGKRKSKSLPEIKEGIIKLLDTAKSMPDKKFLVTKFATNYGGYSANEIQDLFRDLKNEIPENIILPKEFEVRDEGSQGKLFSKIASGQPTMPEKKEATTNKLTSIFGRLGINVKIEYDPNLQVNGEVAYNDGQVIITLNQKQVFDDTIPHEFGHIYIDLLGSNHPLVKEGIEQLRDTNLWNAVKEAYPELNDEQLGKEVLVTAIGRKYSDKNLPKWRYWLNRFFRAIGKLLGIERDVARQLAEDMMADELRTGSGIIPNVGKWQSKQFKNKEQLVGRLADISKANIRKFNEDTAEANKRKNVFKGLLKSLEEQLNLKDEVSLKNGIENFTSIAIKDINNIVALWNSEDYLKNISAKELRTTYEIIKNYDILTEIYNYIEVDSSFSKELKSDMSKAIFLVKSLEAKYIEQGKNLLVKTLSPLMTGPSIQGKGRKALEGEEGIREMLDFLPQDISYFDSMLALASQTRDTPVALAEKLTFDVRVKADMDTQFDNNLINAVLERMKDRGIKLNNKFFEDNYYVKDKNGKVTKYIINPVDYRFYEEYREITDEIEELKKLKNNSDEDFKKYINAIDKLNEWRAKNENTKFKSEYYTLNKYLSDEAKEARFEITKQRDAITSKYGGEKARDLTMLSEEDRSKLAKLDAEWRGLSSIVDENGKLKTGKARRIAESINKFNRKTRELTYFDTSDYLDAYNAAREAAKGRGELDEFDTVNTYRDKTNFNREVERLKFKITEISEELKKFEDARDKPTKKILDFIKEYSDSKLYKFNRFLDDSESTFGNPVYYYKAVLEDGTQIYFDEDKNFRNILDISGEPLNDGPGPFDFLNNNRLVERTPDMTAEEHKALLKIARQKVIDKAKKSRFKSKIYSYGNKYVNKFGHFNIDKIIEDKVLSKEELDLLLEYDSSIYAKHYLLDEDSYYVFNDEDRQIQEKLDKFTKLELSDSYIRQLEKYSHILPMENLAKWAIEYRNGNVDINRLRIEYAKSYSALKRGYPERNKEAFEWFTKNHKFALKQSVLLSSLISTQPQLKGDVDLESESDVKKRLEKLGYTIEEAEKEWDRIQRDSLDFSVYNKDSNVDLMLTIEPTTAWGTVEPNKENESLVDNKPNGRWSSKKGKASAVNEDYLENKLKPEDIKIGMYIADMSNVEGGYKYVSKENIKSLKLKALNYAKVDKMGIFTVKQDDFGQPKPKQGMWESKEYEKLKQKGGLEWELYELLFGNYNEENKGLYLKSQMNYPLMDRVGYRTPNIRKQKTYSAKDYVNTKNPKKAATALGSAVVLGSRREIDVASSSENEEFKGIPKKFIAEMTRPATDEEKEKNPDKLHYIDYAEAETNLAKTMPMFIKEANRYGALTSIINEMQILLDVIGQRKVGIPDSSGLARKSLRSVTGSNKNELGDLTNDELVSKEGFDSRARKRLEDFIDQNFYGVEEDQMNYAGININKVLDTVKRWQSLRSLAFNVRAGINNVALAEFTQMSEALAREYLDKGSYREASKIYTKELGNIVSDVGKPFAKSKINRINDVLNVFQNFDEVLNVGGNTNTKFQTLINSNRLFFINNMGEHMTQSRFAIAYLLNYTIDQSGNLRKKNKGDISLYEQLSFDEKGNPTIEYNDGSKLVKMPLNEVKDVLARVQYRLQGVLKEMHGNYDKDMKVAAQRNALWNLGLQFRKWVYPGYKRRWSQFYYNEMSETFKEGSYRSLWDFVVGAFKNLRAFKYDNVITSISEDHLTNYGLDSKYKEDVHRMVHANVVRAGTELMFLLASTALATFLMSIADDDDDNYWIGFASFILNRLSSEMSFYWNPFSALEILRSPMATMSTIEDFGQFALRTLSFPFNWDEEYERGKRKGKNKWLKETTDLLPIYKQWSSIQHIDEDNKTLNKSYWASAIEHFNK